MKCSFCGQTKVVYSSADGGSAICNVCCQKATRAIRSTEEAPPRAVDPAEPHGRWTVASRSKIECDGGFDPRAVARRIDIIVNKVGTVKAVAEAAGSNAPALARVRAELRGGGMGVNLGFLKRIAEGNGYEYPWLVCGL